ncbi:hypothetical protein OROMI_010145 [Orobanche minor]
MMKDEVLTVKDAVHKLQLSLLEGIKHENQLTAAGSLLSRSDYQDVVTERTIANMCGYPLCNNSLPAEKPWKGRYRVSLKEHKVYDLQETYMYCSSSCLINSRAVAASLHEERSSTLDPDKLNEVLKLFDGFSLDLDVDMGKKGDLGLSGLKIKEKTDTTAGEVSLEEWIGPSNAIDGYVPRRDQNLGAKQSYNNRKSERREQIESKHRQAGPNVTDLSNDMDFTSIIITQDEYSISKTVPLVEAKELKGKASSKDVKRKGNPIQKPTALSANTQETRSKSSSKSNNLTTTDVKISILEDSTGPSQNDTCKVAKELHLRKESGADILKPSLKTSKLTKATHTVTWADGQNIYGCKELKDNEGAIVTYHSADEEVGQESYKFASTGACPMALNQAAEAVASGKSEASDAVRPPPGGEDEVIIEENGDVMDTDPLQLKWPLKPGFSNAEMFDTEDSWYETPPEGFNLTLSPFSTMFMAFFAWISSSSLAYIYGKEESFHEEYLSVNGREYPHKTVMPDGRSSEIKQTLAGCLARALPGLVAELRLPIPISTLEHGIGRLLDTMSFIDPLPAFRMKQWQVIDLLFLDALSVSRIHALTPYMVGRRNLLPKNCARMPQAHKKRPSLPLKLKGGDVGEARTSVLEGAEISVEEFEILKDLMIPLGRVPQLSTQCGG